MIEAVRTSQTWWWWSPFSDVAPRTAEFLCAFYPHYFINVSEKWKTETECLLDILAA